MTMFLKVYRFCPSIDILAINSFYKCETRTRDKKIIIYILVIIIFSANFVPNPLPTGKSILAMFTDLTHIELSLGLCTG